MRLGIAGAGGAASLVGAALREADGIELRGCAAAKRASAERFAREHGAARAYEGLEPLLADEEVDAVYLATPNALHHRQALAALAAGKHVLVEKPMALRTAEAEELAAAAERAGLVLGVGFHLRHADVFRELQRLVAAGAVGEPRFVRAAWGMPLPELSGWKQDRALAGAGSLMGLGVHLLDLVLWLVEGRAGAVAAVSDASGERLDRNYAIALAIGDCLAEVAVSRSFALGASLDLYGAGGELHADGAVTVRVEGTLRDGDDAVLAEARRNPYAAELEAFAAAIRGEQPFHASARDGVRCVELTEAVLAATERGAARP